MTSFSTASHILTTFSAQTISPTASTPNPAVQGAAPTRGLWAHNLLGLGPPATDDLSDGLEEVLDQYLSEPQSYTDILFYWLVCVAIYSI